VWQRPAVNHFGEAECQTATAERLGLGSTRRPLGRPRKSTCNGSRPLFPIGLMRNSLVLARFLCDPRSFCADDRCFRERSTRPQPR